MVMINPPCDVAPPAEAPRGPKSVGSLRRDPACPADHCLPRDEWGGNMRGGVRDVNFNSGDPIINAQYPNSEECPISNDKIPKVAQCPVTEAQTVRAWSLDTGHSLGFGCWNVVISLGRSAALSTPQFAPPVLFAASAATPILPGH